MRDCETVLAHATRPSGTPPAPIVPKLPLAAPVPSIAQGAVWSCALDPTATLAATASADFSAKVWDALTGTEKLSFQHGHIVRCCCFAGSSTRLATGGAGAGSAFPGTRGRRCGGGVSLEAGLGVDAGKYRTTAVYFQGLRSADQGPLGAGGVSVTWVQPNRTLNPLPLLLQQLPLVDISMHACMRACVHVRTCTCSASCAQACTSMHAHVCKNILKPIYNNLARHKHMQPFSELRSTPSPSSFNPHWHHGLRTM